MGRQEPQLISHKVQILIGQMQDWEYRSGMAIDGAEYTQSHANEFVSRMQNRVMAAEYNLYDDTLTAEAMRREYELCRQRNFDISQRVQRDYEATLRVLSKADSTTEYWYGELSLARQWLASAQAEECRARSVRDEAQRQLGQALAELAAAQAELAAARHRTEYAGQDKDGRPIYRPIDTAPYQAAVREAESAVMRARQYLEKAEAALLRAIADRRAAENRVEGCCRAVEFAEQAQHQAAQAKTAIARANAVFGRLGEETLRTENLVISAETWLLEENAAVDEAKSRAGYAQADEAEAKQTLNLAYQEQRDACLHSAQGRIEIDWRLQQLCAFDAPLSLF
ncbi:hypothetical protein KFZ76_11510 [Methylovulum psychrotolerans]|jgi:hypothetical protein|uniref:hypothetical protein n=1 Tax=Methylovulum psychrotolerans TaxID=1704499 RepID=UPI001BFF16AE|nr:hypothetical protein [Methylovulum psychrotolerans]MBT9098332.1 hypothetical protein [Methylovulum psychrotolerans]